MINALNNVEKRIARLISGIPLRTSPAPAAARADLVHPDPITQQGLAAMLNSDREDEPG